MTINALHAGQPRRLHCKHSNALRESCKGNIVESIIPLCYSGKIRPAPCTMQKHGNLVSHAIIAHAISAEKKIHSDKMGRSNAVCDAKHLIGSFASRARNYFRRAKLFLPVHLYHSNIYYFTMCFYLFCVFFD